MTTNEIQAFIRRERPSAAYLGRVEMTDMKHRATLAGWVEPMVCEPDLARLEYAACPLYQVDAERHVGFGQNVKAEAPSLSEVDPPAAKANGAKGGRPRKTPKSEPPSEPANID